MLLATWDREQKKGDINCQDEMGRSALTYATRKGQQRVVRMLLDHGASTEVRNSTTGNTPLIEAAQDGFEAVVQILIDHGADVNARNLKGATAEDVARHSAK